MVISFFSNFLNHHQLPICLEFIKLVGENNFHFIATDRITEERVALGYENMNELYPFVVKDYNMGGATDISRKLAVDSDIAIFTPSAFHYCEDRLKNNKISFLYIERQFKRGVISLAHPKVFKRYFGYQKYRNKPLYLLCAGAFVASDMRLFGFPREKCFKWGYFPLVKEIDIESTLRKKDDTIFKMMWCSRFIDWKRPELAIRLASDLKDMNYKFVLDMYGNGVLLEKIRRIVDARHLDDVVRIHGSVDNKQVLAAMQDHNVFLLTSNRREGWGAVANEAMANCCTLVASNEIGSIPYLIKNGYNGVVYNSHSYRSLLFAVEALMNNGDLCRLFAERSYNIIHSLWSASCAAQRLISLYESLTGQCKNMFEDGPCSFA